MYLSDPFRALDLLIEAFIYSLVMIVKVVMVTL